LNARVYWQVACMVGYTILST